MIRYTQRAMGHLQSILAYLDENAPEYADETIDRILDTIDSLAYFPQRGVPMPELLDEGGDIRELYHAPYRIAYLIEDAEITVLAIAHMKQNRTRFAKRDDA